MAQLSDFYNHPLIVQGVIKIPEIVKNSLAKGQLAVPVFCTQFETDEDTGKVYQVIDPDWDLGECSNILAVDKCLVDNMTQPGSVFINREVPKLVRQLDRILIPQVESGDYLASYFQYFKTYNLWGLELTESSLFFLRHPGPQVPAGEFKFSELRYLELKETLDKFYLTKITSKEQLEKELSVTNLWEEF